MKNLKLVLRHTTLPAGGTKLTGKTRLRFSPTEASRFCGRLFLARVSQARHEAEEQREVLAGEDRAQPSPRPAGDAGAPCRGLAGLASVGA